MIVSGSLKSTPAKVIGWHRELARQCEIRQILILLIVEASPAKLSPYHSQMLSAYQNSTFGVAKKVEENGTASTAFVSFLPPAELVHLKDFVLAVTRKDLRRAVEASEKLILHLDATETTFVDYLVDLCPHPSGN